VSFEQLRTDRRVVEQAAAQLRHQAILDGYAGLERKDVAFALALVLDELARHLRDLEDDLRGRVAELSHGLLGGRTGNLGSAGTRQ
jgi:hypothetical protein